MQLAVNAKMLQTSLTETVSAFVHNEKQQIEISSKIVPESYVKLKVNLEFIYFLTINQILFYKRKFHSMA
jgi:hypothetical protein